MDIVQSEAERMRVGLAVFNRMLAGRDFLAGDSVSALDFVVFPFLKYAAIPPAEDDDELFHRILDVHQPMDPDEHADLAAWIARSTRCPASRRRRTCARRDPRRHPHAARGAAAARPLRRADAERRSDRPRRRLQRGRGARADPGPGSLVAVHGNVDSAELRRELPESTAIDIEGATIAIVHDAGPAKGRLARMRARFPDADAVIFGHSHMPLHETDELAADSRSSTRAARPSAAVRRATRWASQTLRRAGPLRAGQARPVAWTVRFLLNTRGRRARRARRSGTRSATPTASRSRRRPARGRVVPSPPRSPAAPTPRPSR